MTITALSWEQLADRDDPRWTERVSSVGAAQSLVTTRRGDQVLHEISGQFSISAMCQLLANPAHH